MYSEIIIFKIFELFFFEIEMNQYLNRSIYTII